MYILSWCGFLQNEKCNFPFFPGKEGTSHQHFLSLPRYWHHSNDPTLENLTWNKKQLELSYQVVKSVVILRGQLFRFIQKCRKLIVFCPIYTTTSLYELEQTKKKVEKKSFCSCNQCTMFQTLHTASYSKKKRIKQTFSLVFFLFFVFVFRKVNEMYFCQHFFLHFISFST